MVPDSGDIFAGDEGKGELDRLGIECFVLIMYQMAKFSKMSKRVTLYQSKY